MNYDARFFKYVQQFIMIYLPKNRCMSANTIKAYKDTINLLRLYLQTTGVASIKQISFDILDRQTIYQFLGWLENDRLCTVTTRNHRLAVLKSFFKYAAQEDPTLMINYIDISQIPAKRAPDKRIEYLSEKALNILFKQPARTLKGIRDTFLMILMYDTGARVQEILDLRVKDIHIDQVIPNIYLTGKGGKMRVVPLLKKTIEHYDCYISHYHPQDKMHDENYLFYTVIKGKVGPMSPDNVAYFLKRYGDMARQQCPEIPGKIHPHLIRHTKAMHLYQAGMPLSYIKDFLGHASINTTNIYAKADVTMLKAALEKAQSKNEQAIPTWLDDEEILLKLCGLS